MGRSSNNVELHRSHYRKKFVESLDECALHRFGSEERFLFHARLTLEASVRAVFTKTGKTPTKGTADLLKELQANHLVQATQVADFDVIRTRTNPAAHVPVPGESIQRDSVSKVADNLKLLWDWVAEHVDFPEDERGCVERALKAIDGDPPRVSPDQELARLQKEVEELRASARVEQRRSRSSRRPTTPGSASGWRVLGGLAIGLVVGGAMGTWLPGAHVTATPTERRVTPDGGTPEASGAQDTTSDAGVVDENRLGESSTGAMTDTATPAPSDVVVSCPDSMTRVEATSLELAPPTDRQWCSGRGGRTCSRQSLEVPSFCVMNRVVSLEDLRARFPDPEPGCRYDVSQDAAHCVSTGRATEYCEATFGVGGRLPSVAELELAHRSSVVALPTAPLRPTRFEWTLDRCPSPSFGGTPDPTKAHASAGRIGAPPSHPVAQISWHCPPDVPMRTHQFRCVLPVD